MNKHRNRIKMGILFLIILVGTFAVVSFSPKLTNIFQRAVAKNEEESTESSTSESTETNTSENTEISSSESTETNTSENTEISSSENTEISSSESTETNTSENTEISSSESTETTSSESIEISSNKKNENLLTFADTKNGVSTVEDDAYKPLSTVESIDALTDVNYTISFYEDWVKLKELSNVSSLEGKVFHIYYPNNSSSAKTWYLDSTHISDGIGSEEYPFAGTLTPYYDGMTIQTNVALFHSLSSKAVIGNDKNYNPFTISNNIVNSTSVEGGLAKNYVLEDESVDLKNNLIKIKIIGKIQGIGTVGGLFGKVTKRDVIESSAVTLSENISVDLTGISMLQGSIAGGLFGEVSGNVAMNLDSMPSVVSKVTADDPTNYTDPLTLTVCAGGLIGKMSDGSKLMTSSDLGDGTHDYWVIENQVDGEGISGGLVGVVDHSEVKLSYIQKNSLESGTVEPYISAKYICGGFIGLVQSSKVELSYLKLNVDVKAYYINYDRVTAAGGVVGKYITESEDSNSYLKISDITTGNTLRLDMANNYTQRIMVFAHENYSRNNTGGGVIGSCNGNQVTIEKINFSPYFNNTTYPDKEVYNISLTYAISLSENITAMDNVGNKSISGGVAGAISGLDIKISDITFNFVHSNFYHNSNSISGNYVGNIAGIVGWDNQTTAIPTKMEVSNIDVKNSYIVKATSYHGGLFGYVKKGAVICLSGEINLSKIPFKALPWNNNYDNSNDVIDRILAPGGYRGLIVGYAEQSLIYFEVGANVTRSIKIDEETGKLVSNIENIAWDSDDGWNFKDCIDDIGNTGSVFRNIEIDGAPVIDYSKPYGSEVMKTLEKDENGNYVISSLADALVLAIAGQTFEPGTGALVFAKDSFGTTGTEEAMKITDILSAHYVIATDLNLGEANIHSFLRNDSAYGFSGSMIGKMEGATPKITLNSISKHPYGGLYPLLSDGVTFENLTIDGKMWYHVGGVSGAFSLGGSGSIAARAKGTGTFRNIDIHTWIKGDMWCNMSENYRMFPHGGLIGEYGLLDGTLTVEDCTIAPKITQFRANNFIGGMIGRVDTSANTNKVGNILITDVTLSADITADNNLMIYNNVGKAHVRTAGLIAYIGDDYSFVSTINGNNHDHPITNIYDATYAKISLSNINIMDTRIDLNISTPYVNMSGGLLGYAWCHVETEMENISVTNGTINSLGSVGGLITFLAGKFEVKSVNLNSLNMTSIDKNRTYSGLLFGNGERAYIILHQDGYVINTSEETNENGEAEAYVQINGYSPYFDEIVGINVKRKLYNDAIAISNIFDHEIEEEYANGGIVNIINSNFSDFSADTYESYTNKVCTTTNKYTRYYYNLFQDDEWNVDVEGNSINIKNEKQLMTWHVSNYANTTLSRFFVKYFENDNSYRTKRVVNLQANTTFDMNGYSLYPTYINGGITINGDSSKIILYGEEISDIELALKDNDKSKVYRNNELIGKSKIAEYTQHYLMHASLLYCVDTANISGLTLGGSIANNGDKTGSLIGGRAVGAINISNIVFDGLRVSHYDTLDGESAVCGLMLGTVGIKNGEDVATKLVIKNVNTTDAYNSIEKPAAGALITRVGSDKAKNIQVSFEDMKLDSKIDSNIFQYAAFMYSFQHSNDSMDNKSYGIYTFEYIDTVDGPGPSNIRDDHNVTYGLEIKEGVNYNDKYRNEVGEGYANPLESAIIEAGVPTYRPYVYLNMGIFVNPKNGNITEGCGTYEDPYIIENPAQLLTVFCYLSGEQEIYRSLLRPGDSDEAAWKVAPIGGGGDGYQCIASSTPHTMAVYGKLGENFPTVDDMRTAYYMITKDIDLSYIDDVNYNVLVKRFYGLGSYHYPFSGVIVGKKITDGNGSETFPTITLPDNDNITYSHFGLIEYMQGAVIKDLNITNNNDKNVKVTNMVGGVASYILGGDNIIDNVTVGIKATINDSTVAGGYVGVIKNGSLILRNIKGKYVADGCIFGKYNTNGGMDYYTTFLPDKTLISDGNMGVGLLVGKVEDGYILYDNNNEFAAEKKIIKIDDMPVTSREEVIPLVNGFQIINGYSLDVASGDDYTKRIPINWYEEEGLTGFKINAYNSEQLEILALALNSDSLSIYINDSYNNSALRTTYDNGYNYTAKCRKATYADVGSDNAKDGSSTDCTFAKEYDDGRAEEAFGYLYPYLCQKYMCVTDDSNSVSVDDSNSVSVDDAELDRYNKFKKTIACIETTDTSNPDVTIKKYISKLNKIDVDVCQYTTSYNLCANENYIYDLSVYENSFRGFGALYSKKYSDFRANFNGNNCSVKMNMDRNWDENISITGMFNSLIYDNNNKETDEIEKFIIRDLVIVDSVIQNRLFKENVRTKKDKERVAGAACGSATGALAGEVQGAWEFNSIVFKRSESCTASTNYQNLLQNALSDEEFQREMVCGVRGYMNVGGLIGRINVTSYKAGNVNINNPTSLEYRNTGLHNDSNHIQIRNCSVQGFDETNRVNIQGGDHAFAVGGLVGSVGANMNTYEYHQYSTRCFYFGTIAFEGCSVNNVNILAKNSGFMGGFAGTVGYRQFYYWRTAGEVIVDKYEDKSNTVEQVKILSSDPSDKYDQYSAGGVFGQIELLPATPLNHDNQNRYHGNADINTENERAYIGDVTVSNLVINNRNNKWDIDNAYVRQGNTGGIGGLVGFLSCRKTVIKRVQVLDSQIGYYDGGTPEIEDDQYALTHVGGLIGVNSSNGEYANEIVWYGVNRAFYTNMTGIYGAKVTNSIIATKQQETYAGGLIGYSTTEYLEVTKDVPENDDSGNADSGSADSGSDDSGNADSGSDDSGNADSGSDDLGSDDSGNADSENVDWQKVLITNNEISANGVSGDAGGVIGKLQSTTYVPYPDSGVTTTFIAQNFLENLDLSGNMIASKNQLGDAGGLVGELSSDLYNNYECRLILNEIQVGADTLDDKDENIIVGYDTAGGLCGRIKGMTYISHRNYVRVGTTDSGNTIIGRVAGGFYGKIDDGINSNLTVSGFSELFETDVTEILNNKIIACSEATVSSSSSETKSGGVAGVRGYYKPTTKVATYTLKNNVIIATGDFSKGDYSKFLCAGMFGEIYYSKTQNYHQEIQYYDDIVMENNSIGYYPVLNEKGITNMDGAIEHFTSPDTELDYKTQDVCIFKWENNTTLAYDNWRNYEINESNVGDYAWRIGSFIGNCNNVAMHTNFFRPTVIYSNEVGSIPAIDIASTSYGVTVPSSDYGCSYPYNYKINNHIIYFDDYKSDSIVDITSSSSGVKPVLDGSVLMQHVAGTDTTAPIYETDYFFGNIEDIVSEYSEVKNTVLGAEATEEEKVNATYNFLISKRLDITMGGTKTENLICASENNDDYFSKTYFTDVYNGVPVIVMDAQPAMYIGDYVAAILTNGGGVIPDNKGNFYNLLSLSCVNAYIDPNGKIYELTSGNIQGTPHPQSSLTVSENKLNATRRPFDQVIETAEGYYYTITLVRYKYKSFDYTGKEKYETIYFPVFVKEKVTMNSYLSILSGEEYSLTEACTNGRKDEVVVAHDSVYTIYCEFVYDAVRLKEKFSDIIMEKTLTFETLGADDKYQPFNLKPGIKYTLVDVQTGREYYYTTPEDVVSSIPFSDFKDKNGESYQQRNIGEDGITITKDNYTSIGYYGGVKGTDTFPDTSGLERFFIVAEPTGIDNNVSYRISISTKAVGENQKDKEEFVRKFEFMGISITQIPGPLISFEGVKENNGILEGTEGVTWISGSIEKDKTLEVDGRIRVSLVPPNGDPGRNGSPYWIYKAVNKTIDSANAGKYLEIGVTLIDSETNQVVQWPEGTNVIMNGGSPIPLQGNSVIYNYKDNGQEFSFDSLTHNIANGEWYYYNIDESVLEPNYQWITQGNGGNWYYQEHDTNGKLVDIPINKSVLKEEYISCSNQCHLEFDFSVADIKEYIGKNYIVKINLYRSSDPEFPLEEAGKVASDGTIREYYETILASGVVDLAVAVIPDDLWDLGINLYKDENKKYEIPFTNKVDFANLIGIKSADADIAECAGKNYMVVYRIYKKTKKSDGYKYELVDLNSSGCPFTLFDSSSEEMELKQLIHTRGDGMTTSEYAFVTSRNFTAEEIKLGTDGSTPYVVNRQMKLIVDGSMISNEDLANYKLEATYMPYEGEQQPITDSESTLKDYYIFTIAKLKTDF